MDPITLFLTYFNAFEETYVDDDWSRLEPLFAPGAVYRVTGTGRFDCEIEGRDAVFAGIKRCLDGFDRQCTRRVGALRPPVAEGSTVSAHGTATYTRGESPELTLELEETIRFEDGRIVEICDDYVHGLPSGTDDWLARWGEGLRFGYL